MRECILEILYCHTNVNFLIVIAIKVPQFFILAVINFFNLFSYLSFLTHKTCLYSLLSQTSREIFFFKF